MKRFSFITALCSAGILAVWMIFQAFAASPANTKDDSAPIQVQDVTGNEAAIPVTAAEARRIAPVYDAAGDLVADPTGTIWNAIHSGDMKVAPVYNAAGELVSDPTGTILSASNSLAVPVTGAGVKIAPVYDATGALVSDPTGTIWSAVNP